MLGSLPASLLLLSTVSVSHGKLKYFEDIEKPEQDDRSYRAFELGNGMTVLVISDPKTDTAAAALQVGIGALHDPWDIQGMAHFTEHMLFIGSKKYPELNGYANFIIGHGGRLNGYTEKERVTYWYSVSVDYFEEALDRFAQFFLGPLFTESATDREISVVDSEFYLRNKDDRRRNWRLRQYRATPNHDLAKFLMGNNESIAILPREKGLVPHDEVVKYYNKWYSSNLMNLVILGKESLDELTKMVEDRFPGVRNQNISVEPWSQPYGKEQLLRYIKVKQINDKDSLSFDFPLTDVRPLYRSKPDKYLSYVINDESKGSLASYLKKKGWIESITFDVGTIAPGIGYGSFLVVLTEEGQKREKEIAVALFEYLYMLRRVGPRRRLFKELQRIEDLNFKYQEKGRSIPVVRALVDNVRRYPFSQVISATKRIWDYDAKAIRTLLEELVPENVMIYRFSKNAFKDSELNKEEEWYGIKYSEELIEPDLLSAIKNAGFNEEFHLPGSNKFIADSTKIKPKDTENGPLPELVKSAKAIQAWYLQDPDIKIPKVAINMKLTSSYSNDDPSHTALLWLFAKLVYDSLNEELYPATKAGLLYNLAPTKYHHGIAVVIRGYEDKQGPLIDTIFDRLVSFEPDPVRFAAIKEQYVKQLENFKFQAAYMQNWEYLKNMMVERRWLNKQLLNATKGITVDKLKEYGKLFFTRVHVDLLGVGNLVREDVIGIANRIEDKVKSADGFSPMPLEDLLPMKATRIPEGDTFLYQERHPVDEDNNINIHMQMMNKTSKNDLIMELIPLMMRIPIFTELRTRQHLGYGVYTYVESFSNGISGVGINVQSDKLPAFVIDRVDEFLATFQDTMRNMTEEAFEEHKKSLATLRFEKPKSLTARVNYYWWQIASHYLNLDWDRFNKNDLKKITKDDVQAAYDKFIAPSSPHRKRIMLYVTGTEAEDNGYKPEVNCESDKVTCVDDKLKFKEEQEKYPLWTPFKTVKQVEEECPRKCTDV